MNKTEKQVLETASTMYGAIPAYLAGEMEKEEFGHLLIDLIDALDDIEFKRSGRPLYDIIEGNAPGKRKKSILQLEQKYNLTEKESHILRFLANGRNPSYISNVLGVSQTTVKTHKYSIFKKLGVHSMAELNALLDDPNQSADHTTESDS